MPSAAVHCSSSAGQETQNSSAECVQCKLIYCIDRHVPLLRVTECFCWRILPCIQLPTQCMDLVSVDALVALSLRFHAHSVNVQLSLCWSMLLHNPAEYSSTQDSPMLTQRWASWQVDASNTDQSKLVSVPFTDQSKLDIVSNPTTIL